MEFKVNKNPSAKDLTQFGWVMLIGLGVIGSLFWLIPLVRGKDPLWTIAYVLWAIGSVIFVVEILLPLVAGDIIRAVLGKHIYVGWMTVATYMGMVMVPLFLTLLYFIFLLPFTLIRVKDPLRMKLTSSGTYWEEHKNHEATLERMRRPF